MEVDRHVGIVDRSDPDDLSPDEIDAILKRAEQRLRDAKTLIKSASIISTSSFPEIRPSSLPQPYVQAEGGVARPDGKSLVSEKQRQLAAKPKVISDPVLQKRQKKEKPPTLAAWHGLPRTNLTPELKRDLQLLHMRSVLDPKRMYKKQGKMKIPEYSQIGTLIEGPTEFYSARINNKDRKRTLLEETLATEAESGRVKKKFVESQVHKASGKKAWYRALKNKRKAGIWQK